MFPVDPIRVLDLGCGSGILAIMLALQRPLWQLEGLDIQAELLTLASANASAQGLDIRFFTQDLRGFHDEDGYDLIVSNPPWQKAGEGLPSPDPSREISRRELYCCAEDVMACLARNLKPRGKALLLYPSRRETELRKLAENYLLDIIQALPSAETNKYLILEIRAQGKTP